MGKELLVVGGGHAHLTVLNKLGMFTEQDYGVTVVNPDEYHYYSGMGPGMLGGKYRPVEIRFAVREMAERAGGRFIRDRVVRIDPERRRVALAQGAELPYDVASFNTGSGVPFPIPDRLRNRRVFPVKPIVHLADARERILEQLRGDRVRLLVVGGGPAGVEMAGNLKRLVKKAHGKAAITLIAGRRLLAGFPERARNVVLRNFMRRGIDVVEQMRGASLADEGLTLEGGEEIRADTVFLATGVRPGSLFADSGVETGPDGGMAVDRHLESVSHPGLFGGGDCIHFRPRPLDRVGVYAVRQNMVLFHNLLSAMKGGEEREPFQPQETYMLILNLGDGQGVFIRDGWVWRGRLAWMLKHYIDTDFMRKMRSPMAAE
jgi:NADH dehydrogenase FAD-containing subunit